MKNRTTIAFDADDTLWVNEIFFRQSEARLCEMLSPWATCEDVIKELYRVESNTLMLYGYGIKGFVLSMTEAALNISGGQAEATMIKQIIDMGKDQIERPVELMPGVHEVLDSLKDRYKLVVATKGDLLDQQRKLGKSGLEGYFDHIEIMSDKKTENYRALTRHLAVDPDDFVMVGNSLRSDIIPVLELGARAVYVPCDTTWQHEVVDEKPVHKNFHEIACLGDLLSAGVL